MFNKGCCPPLVSLTHLQPSISSSHLIQCFVKSQSQGRLHSKYSVVNETLSLDHLIKPQPASSVSYQLHVQREKQRERWRSVLERNEG